MTMSPSLDRSGPGPGLRRLAGRLAGLGAALLAAAVFSAGAEIPCVWSGIERIVAVGDLHGDFENFVSILKEPKVGLVDEGLHWIGGRTHLVQIGDMLDRGDRAKDILDLLMRLEKEAAAAGGMVHVLLGNHEEATLTGIALSYPGYVYVEQFFDFLPADFKKAREKEFMAQRSPEERARIRDLGLDLRKDAAWRDFWDQILERSRRSKGLDEAGQAYTENFNATYGQWLLKKNAVIKINDIIFVHAGINLRYSMRQLTAINDAFRFELGVISSRHFTAHALGAGFQARVVYDPESPLRVRLDEENTTKDQMDKILANLGAGRMVIGHNFLTSEESRSPVVPSGNVVPLFGGRLWMIDTGIGYTLYGGRLYALIIKDGEFDHFGESGESEPAPAEEPARTAEGPRNPDEIEKYLRSAAPLFVIPGGAGRTDPWKIRLDLDGVKRWGQFKYIDRPRPAQLADSYRYELAAYALSKHLGLGVVPPVVGRTINDTAGALQIFVEDAFRESDRKSRNAEVGDPKAFEEAMADLKVFLSLVNDRCDAERDRDILIQRETGTVFAVDFSQAFDPKSGEGPGCVILRCSRALYRTIQHWDQGRVDLLLGPHLNAEELRALRSRVTSILETINELIATKGESAVLF